MDVSFFLCMRIVSECVCVCVCLPGFTTKAMVIGGLLIYYLSSLLAKKVIENEIGRQTHRKRKLIS